MRREWPCEPKLFGPARQAYMALSEIDQATVDRLVDSLCWDPDVDGITKFDHTGEPAVWRAALVEGWRIIYDLRDDNSVLVVLGLRPIRR